MNGMIGKMLRINLSELKTSSFSIDGYLERYLGGRGLASRLYWEEIAPGVKAFDATNKLIFVNGALVGSGAQGATVMTVVGKSPGRFPEGYCYGFLAGYVGTELKKAGYDGIIVEGRASDPVYINIQDQQVSILSAREWWGKSAYRTAEEISKEYTKEARFITIGVSGERRVRTAIALASFDSTLSCGFGAVMGSKNLKAIVIKGSGKIQVADPEKLINLTRYSFNISKRLHAPVPFQIVSTGHGHLIDVMGKASCYKCGSFCHRSTLRYGKRADLTSGRRCQAIEYYLPWIYGHEDEPIETLFYAPVLANDYSIDTFELENIVRWLYACYREKCLGEEETGLPLSKIGTREFLEKLLHSIAFREGFGDILAEGQLRAGDKISPAARSLYSHQVNAIGQYETTPTRKFFVQSLLIPMEPRPDQPLLHAQTNLWMAWEANLRDPSLSPVDTKVVHAVAKVYWGSEGAGDMSSYAGKSLAAVKIQDRGYLHDSLGLCNFTWPITYSFNTQDHVGDPLLEGKIYNAVTGQPEDHLDECAGRIADLQRAILMREGRQFPGADHPRDYLFSEPLTPGIPQLVPGPEGPVDASGNRLDRVKFQAMLEEFYKLRNWNRQTGLPESSI